MQVDLMGGSSSGNNESSKEEVEKVEEMPKKEVKKEKESVEKNNVSLGAGMDIGTGNLVSARSVENKAVFKLQRDAFFSIENNPMSINMLKKLDANYIKSDNGKEVYVIGEAALQMANFFNKECRRPLSKGVISTHEKEALMMIKLILKGMLGEPKEKNEVCHFSVPAKPVDQKDYNVVYHENVLKSFVSSFGYDAVPMNEALAIVWAEMAEENYTGCALSFGAGMVNVALAFMGVSEPNHQFSVSRSGDWIDENAAMAVGLKASRITAIKEGGVDLLNPKDREETAIKIYYDNLINYVCDAMEKKLTSTEDVPNFPDAINIILSGGTSKPINFDKVFEEEIMKRSFPFQINEVRRASDPLNAVAKGCLLNSLNQYD